MKQKLAMYAKRTTDIMPPFFSIPYNRKKGNRSNQSHTLHREHEQESSQDTESAGDCHKLSGEFPVAAHLLGHGVGRNRRWRAESDIGAGQGYVPETDGDANAHEHQRRHDQLPGYSD